MKIITIVVAAIFIYFIWQISRVSLGCAIVSACGAFALLVWMNNLSSKQLRRNSQIRKHAREQHDLINN